MTVSLQLPFRCLPHLRPYRDGNNVNRKGALLTASVPYRAITGESPTKLPNLRIGGVRYENQAVPRDAARMAPEIMTGCMRESGL